MAAVAVEKGVPTKVAYFGVQTAKALVAEGVKADLLLANNVLAHVSDLNDFVAGASQNCQKVWPSLRKMTPPP